MIVYLGNANIYLLILHNSRLKILSRGMAILVPSTIALKYNSTFLGKVDDHKYIINSLVHLLKNSFKPNLNKFHLFSTRPHIFGGVIE